MTPTRLLTCAAALLAAAPSLVPHVTAYDLVREYSGISFFDRWDWYSSWDNLTLSNVTWVDAATAYTQQLALVNSDNHVIMKVDDTTNVPMGGKRNSVRITSQDTFGVGSLWILDMIHMPYGCSVWPAFWSKGPTWPDDGEIDIIEQINLATSNQMALHSTPGCFQATPVFQTGLTGGDSGTGNDCSKPSGCVVRENSPNSYGAGFAAAGGGVWAAQFDVQGVFIWFWSRPNVPAAITTAASGIAPLDIGTFGPPSAAFTVQGCKITDFFKPQQLVFDIALCGNWAGLPSAYNTTCGNTGPTGNCYADNVVGNGDNYANAYFEIKYLRAYTTGGPTPTPQVPGMTLGNKGFGATATANAAPRRFAPDAPLGAGGAPWRTLAMGAMVALGASWGAGMGLGLVAGVGW